jgi:hypothetical protein
VHRPGNDHIGFLTVSEENRGGAPGEKCGLGVHGQVLPAALSFPRGPATPLARRRVDDAGGRDQEGRPYFCLKRPTRPAVSTIFCLPV